MVTNVVNDKTIKLDKTKPRQIGDLKQVYLGSDFVLGFSELTEAFRELWWATGQIANVPEKATGTNTPVTSYNRDMHVALFNAAVRDILKAAKLSL